MMSKTDALKSLPLRFGFARVGLGRRFLLSVAVMAAYMIASRIIYHAQGLSFAEIELLRTPFRFIAAVLFWLLMADAMFERQVNLGSLRRPAAICALVLMAVSPLVTGEFGATMTDAAIVAIASLPVAVYEEFFFRGILQTLLVRHMGVFHGISVSTMCFMLFHVGVVDTGVLTLILIFLAGSILGLVYFATGSMAVVIVTHAAYDILVAFPGDALLPRSAAVLFLTVALFLLAASARAKTQ